MPCNICHIGSANYDLNYGVLPCDSCKIRHRNFRSPHKQVEFISESIKEQRKAYRTDYLPMHNRGELDKGFVDRYGEKKAKERGFTDTEIKNAKYVWKNTDTYYTKEL